MAGNVGAKERFEYTVIGEPVHEAARWDYDPSFRFWEGEVEPCINGRTIETGAYFVAERNGEILGGAGWSPLDAEVRAGVAVDERALLDHVVDAGDHAVGSHLPLGQPVQRLGLADLGAARGRQHGPGPEPGLHRHALGQ